VLFATLNRQSFVGAPRLMVVVGLLMLTLGVAAALAWHAYQAAESHRDAASRVQRDYVAFAGWEFSRAASVELRSRVERWLDVIACEVRRGGLPPPAGLGTCGDCHCGDLKTRSLFVVDIGSEDVTVTGDPLGAESQRWVMDVASGRIRISPSQHPHVVRVGLIDDAPLVLAAGHVKDRFGVPIRWRSRQTGSPASIRRARSNQT
jgi:hypothetical protein